MRRFAAFLHNLGSSRWMGMMWLSLSRWGISKSLNPVLIKSEFFLMSSLRFSDFFATSIALIEAAAILGFAEEVKIK